MNYTTELHVDMFDLLRRIIIKWRSLLFISLVFGMLAGGYKIVELYSQNNNRSMLEDTYNEAVEDSLSKLTAGEAYQVEFAKITYDKYMSIYQQYLVYTDDSIYFNLNGNCVSACINLYNITDYSSEDNSVYTDSNKVDDIISAYNNVLNDDKTINNIIDTLGIKTTPNYLNELITISNVGQDNMRVQVFGRSEEECRIIMDEIDKRINSTYNDIYIKIPHNIMLLSSSYQESYVPSIVDRQKNTVDVINSLKNNMMTVPGTFTTDQKAYYAALLGKENIKSSNDDNLASESSEGGFDAALILKNIIVGMIFGALLTACFVVLKYIFSPYLRRKEDFVDAFNIPVLGEVEDLAQSTVIGLISEQITIGRKKNKLACVVLSGSNIDDIVASAMSKVNGLLLEESGRLEGSILQNSISLEAVADCGGIVLFERIGKSKYGDISREIDICKNNGICILGAVVIR